MKEVGNICFLHSYFRQILSVPYDENYIITGESGSVGERQAGVSPYIGAMGVGVLLPQFV